MTQGFAASRADGRVAEQRRRDLGTVQVRSTGDNGGVGRNLHRTVRIDDDDRCFGRRVVFVDQRCKRDPGVGLRVGRIVLCKQALRLGGKGRRIALECGDDTIAFDSLQMASQRHVMNEENQRNQADDGKDESPPHAD